MVVFAQVLDSANPTTSHADTANAAASGADATNATAVNAASDDTANAANGANATDAVNPANGANATNAVNPANGFNVDSAISPSFINARAPGTSKERMLCLSRSSGLQVRNRPTQTDPCPVWFPGVLLGRLARRRQHPPRQTTQAGGSDFCGRE